MIDLDVARLTFGKKGIEGFSFPVRREEIVEMREALALSLATAARSENNHPRRIGLALGVAFQSITREAMLCFFADRLINTVGRNFTPPESSRVLPAFRNGTAPKPAFFLSALESGTPEKTWKRLGRPLKSVLRQSGISPTWPTRKWRRCRIIATTRSGLIDSQARNAATSVGFVPATWWFAQPLEANAALPGQDQAIVRDIVAEAIRSAYAAINQTPHTHLVSEHVSATSIAAIGSVQSRLDALTRIELPEDLWTGSGGNIWVRLLRSAVRARGGIVRGHDHASGGGHANLSHYSTNEFFECDEFVAFTDIQADSLRKHMVFPSYLLGPDGPPKIISPSNWRAPPIEPRPTRAREEIQTIMHIGMPFSGERIVNTPLMFDLPMLDWYARLFSWLTSQRYKVIHKIYPSTTRRPNLACFRDLDVRIEERPFEEVVNDADLILFDHATTTTFGHSLRSWAPVTLIDFGILPFNKPALSTLEARCSRVAGFFDDSGKAQVSWEDLKRAIELAPTLTDRSYPIKYLGSPS